MQNLILFGNADNDITLQYQSPNGDLYDLTLYDIVLTFRQYTNKGNKVLVCSTSNTYSDPNCPFTLITPVTSESASLVIPYSQIKEISEQSGLFDVILINKSTNKRTRIASIVDGVVDSYGTFTIDMGSTT